MFFSRVRSFSCSLSRSCRVFLWCSQTYSRNIECDKAESSVHASTSVKAEQDLDGRQSGRLTEPPDCSHISSAACPEWGSGPRGSQAYSAAHSSSHSTATDRKHENTLDTVYMEPHGIIQEQLNALKNVRKFYGSNGSITIIYSQLVWFTLSVRCPVRLLCCLVRYRSYSWARRAPRTCSRLNSGWWEKISPETSTSSW